MTFEWDGFEHLITTCPVDPAASCRYPSAVPAGTYTARFCWGTSTSGATECLDAVEGEQCADVEFELPDADGVVEHVVNHGG